MPRRIKKAVVFTGYHCNNLCRFCISADKRPFPARTTAEIIMDMAEARKTGSTYLEIIGGEQTIRPDILYLVRFGKKLGFRTICMATNGRMLSYKDFAHNIIEAGITDIIFSIHGHNARLHDSLTGAEGSFNQLMQGIKNIKDLGLKRIGSNTTIVRQNYKELPEIGEFIYGQGIRNAEFIFVDPTHGGARRDFGELVPRISEAAVYIKKCLDIGRNNRVEHWHIRYVPLCHFVDYESQISEIHEVKTFETRHFAQDFRNSNVAASRAKIGRQKTARCQGCVYLKSCEGIWREYIKHYGDKELIPKKLADINYLAFTKSPLVKIDILKINPFFKHPKDILKRERRMGHGKTHLAAISDIKRKIQYGKTLEPIGVRKNNKNSYDLVDGFCRFIAFKQLGFKTINAKVIE